MKRILPAMNDFSSTFLRKYFIIILLFMGTGLSGQNLLVNGDFENGGSGTGFTTNYLLPVTAGTSNLGNYNIVTSPFDMNTAFFAPADDHTFANDIGKMMVVDGAGNGGDKVWELINGSTIGVIRGRTYLFSYLIRSISYSNDASNSAIIKVSTNDTTSTPVLTAGNASCPTGSLSPWIQVSYKWTATTGAAQIWLTDEQTNGGGSGNDFALEDITLVEDKRPLAIRYNASGPVCPGSNTGGIFVSGTDGTPPYQYSLNGGAFKSNGYFPVTVSTGIGYRSLIQN